MKKYMLRVSDCYKHSHKHWNVLNKVFLLSERHLKNTSVEVSQLILKKMQETDEKNGRGRDLNFKLHKFTDIIWDDRLVSKYSLQYV